MGKLYIHAPNVHGGGGLTLLNALIEFLPKRTCLIIDERLPVTDTSLSDFEVYRIKPTIVHRFSAEKLLKRLVLNDDNVLCFGNLPPLFSLQGKVTLFIQNRYLIEPELIGSISFKLRLRLTVERFWLRHFEHNVNQVLVQTLSMKVLSCDYVSPPIKIAPFATNINLRLYQEQTEVLINKYDFIYVASGEAHKNHLNLLIAWETLAERGEYPSLCLTVSSELFPELSKIIESKKKQYNLKIDNVGVVNTEDVISLYKKSTALIYPSILESFGLPLIEARQAGLKIIASELDYVRDVLDPDESFDPRSSISITRAVRRFLVLDSDVLPLVTAKEFIGLVLSE